MKCRLAGGIILINKATIQLFFSTLSSVKSITVFDCNIQKRIHVEQSPGRDFGRIHSEHHFFLTDGMCKAKLCCPQAKRIFVLCVVAVFFVTDNGIAHICELNSDLMSASSDEIDHHKTNVRLFCQNLVVKLGVFCALRERGNNLYGVGVRELFEITRELVRTVSGRTVNDCEISLFNAARRGLLRKVWTPLSKFLQTPLRRPSVCRVCARVRDTLHPACCTFQRDTV